MHKKVLILTTGGTIAMKLDPELGVIPAVSGEDLVDSVPGLRDVRPVEVRAFSNVPSPHMTPRLMFELSGIIEEALVTTCSARWSRTARTRWRKPSICSIFCMRATSRSA